MAGHSSGRSNAADVYGYRAPRRIASAQKVVPRDALWYPAGMTTAPLDDKLIERLKVLLEGCTRTELAARCGLSLSTLMKALGGLSVGATTRRLIALQVGK